MPSRMSDVRTGADGRILATHRTVGGFSKGIPDLNSKAQPSRPGGSGSALCEHLEKRRGSTARICKSAKRVMKTSAATLGREQRLEGDGSGQRGDEKADE
jgi:hypothetical protein